MGLYMHGKSIISIAIADDHEMIREALCQVIDNWENCKVTLLAGDGNELIGKIKQKPVVDLVLLDVGMPGLDGYQTAVWLKQNHPSVKVLMVSVFRTELAIARMVKIGVDGFVPKSSGVSELKRAVFEVMKTGTYFSNGAAGLIAKQIAMGKMKNKNIPLKENELLFIKYLCSDMTYKEIASKLRLNERQVDYLRESLFQRFNVQSRVGLTMYAVNSGLV